MREIKFRAWDKENKKIIDDITPSTVEFYGSLNKCFQNTTLMQYTGLKDKNGKEIYEGDFIACDKAKDGFQHISQINFGWSQEDIYGLHWDSGQPIRTVDYVGERYSVIGNIYENPELLSNV